MKYYKDNPEKIVFLGYLSIILIGTILLLLPFSVNHGKVISFTDAMFTSVSAVCVTGLIVQDTQHFFSIFGQIIILILLQIGGLGYMTISTAFILIIGKSLHGSERYQSQNEFQRFNKKDIKSFVFNIIRFTLIVEFIGMLLLIPKMSAYANNFLHAVWLSLFHSISAFCNAGFSIFSQNLMIIKNDIYISIIISLLIVLGGIGFVVISEINRRVITRKIKLFSPHAKIVFISTSAFIVISFIVFFVLEKNNSISTLPIAEQIFTSLFQIITPRTAGFNTVDIGALTLPSLFFIMLLMFVGGSPGGTAGGIKTTTIFIIFYSIIRKLKGKRNVNIFYRKINDETILKSFFIFVLSMLVIAISIFLILAIDKKDFLKTVFEVFSAYGTVGLSIGSENANASFSSDFSNLSKLIIMLVMFTGRIGIMTAAYTFIKKLQKERFSYPETKIMVG